MISTQTASGQNSVHYLLKFCLVMDFPINRIHFPKVFAMNKRLLLTEGILSGLDIITLG